MAFVEFEDIQAATNALNAYNGIYFGGSTLKVEYAKSRMGEKRNTEFKDEI